MIAVVMLMITAPILGAVLVLKANRLRLEALKYISYDVFERVRTELLYKGALAGFITGVFIMIVYGTLIWDS